MKTPCFEISTAMQQHESKISAATAELNGKGSPNWSIGQAYEMSHAVTNRQDENGEVVAPELFVCTILPKDTEWMVGAEPRLVNAVCEGIRSQGLNIANETSVELCRPLAKSLLENAKPTPDWVNEAFVYLRDRTPLRSKDNDFSLNSEDIGSDPSIDYELLRSFVLEKLTDARLAMDESPLAFLNRCSNQMVVLTRCELTDLRSRQTNLQGTQQHSLPGIPRLSSCRLI
jgi:hypothetical protein